MVDAPTLDNPHKKRIKVVNWSRTGRNIGVSLSVTQARELADSLAYAIEEGEA